ncbi:hypothetical protein QBC39DRAFT_360663 [Podospora conica]|nr:hypothetical protein QBC39DRAFT_360663 [Schizothecium conicum]
MAGIGGPSAGPSALGSTEPFVHKGPVPPTGLTVLVEPVNPTLDILFIHGFTGDPEKTWSKKSSPSRNADEIREPPAKKQRLNIRKILTKETTASDVYWPRDLLPSTVPHARVLTYGYDTHIRHRAGSNINKDTLYDIAGNLLVALEVGRRNDSARPILFIVHSLGGIVVKEMLRRARACQLGQAHLRLVFQSTVGIVFFGTPHAGSDPRSFLHKVIERVARATGVTPNENIVQCLLPASERLKELRETFGPMAQEQNWAIHSFQEQFSVGALGCKVVDDTSSCLNLPSVEVTEHIGRNHMEMCRFSGPDDNEYKKVVAVLTRITTARPTEHTAGPARSTIASSEHLSPERTSELTEEQKQGLLDSFRFDQIDARHMTIKTAHAKTCRWLLGKSEYLDWCDPGKLAQHNGFLWIKGKPGAGKSTLMKFALTHTRQNATGQIILSFFFNARGDDLEKSTSGLFRSLLVQLLEQLPSIKIRSSTLDSPMWKSRHGWTLESLKSLFEEAVLNLQDATIICFVDALDECDDAQVREMVSFFEGLGEKTLEAAIPFRVCFASRHYPHITMSKEHNLILEGQEGHDQDIVNYLSAKLKIGRTKLAEQIRADVQNKASGVFMWVVLVTDILNKEFDGGRIHSLRKRIREIPADLHELFHSILTRDTSNKEDLLLCIQWVLFAMKPLTPTQLYFAILSGTDPDALLEWDKDATTPETIAKFLLDSSKGLTEITKSKNPTVQFIHESVRDFLLKEDGLREVWSDLGDNFEATSQDALKKCCLDCIRHGIIDTGLPDPLPKASSEEAADLRHRAGKANPFLEYATHQVLHHAEAAAKGGSDQGEFLSIFPLDDWMRWQNVFEKHEIRRYKKKPSLCYIFAERDLASLIKLLPASMDCLAVEDQRYNVPILAALVGEKIQALQSMLERIAKTLPPTSPFHKRYKDFQSQHPGKTRDKFHTTLPSELKTSLFYYLLKYGAYDLLPLLLFTRRIDVELSEYCPSYDWRRILGEEGERAAEVLLDLHSVGELPDLWPGVAHSPITNALGVALTLDHAAAVKHLLTRHTDKSLSATDYRVLLKQTIGLHDVQRLETLLSTLDRAGVPTIVLPIKDEEGLDFGAFTQNKAMVALLQSGAYLEATKDVGDEVGVTLIAHGDGQVARFLTASCSGIETRDWRSRTTLMVAAENMKPKTIDALLRLGANTEATDFDGNPVLFKAVTASPYPDNLKKHADSVELLCSRGANVEVRDPFGRTLLMHTVVTNKYLAAATLLKWGACVHARDERGQTPLFQASRFNTIDMCRLLLDNGADVNAKDKDGLSVLAWAARGRDPTGAGDGSFQMVVLLLNRGADIHAKDNRGLSALSWAAKEQNTHAVELLLYRGAKREEMDWEAIERLHGQEHEALDEEDHEGVDDEDQGPLDAEDEEKDGLETPAVCEVCIGRRFKEVAEAAPITDVSNGLDGMNGLEEMDESDGMDVDGL